MDGKIVMKACVWGKPSQGLEVVELEEEAGDGEGEEAADGHRGSACFTLCFEFTAFLLLRLHSFSFLHPVNVGSGRVHRDTEDINELLT